MHNGSELRLLWSAAHHHRVTGVALEQGVEPMLVPNAIPIALYHVELSLPSIFLIRSAPRLRATVNQRTDSGIKAYR